MRLEARNVAGERGGEEREKDASHGRALEVGWSEFESEASDQGQTALRSGGLGEERERGSAS